MIPKIRHQTILNTNTSEPYLPTRLVYTVFKPVELRQWFKNHASMAWDPRLKRWTWNLDRHSRKLKFPDAYEEVLRRDGGLVLASCYLRDDHLLHVYTRCGLRAARFLSFFDKEVPRTTAIGEFVDEYNLISTVRTTAEIRTPEEYFRDESKIEFFDIITLLDEAKTPSQKVAVIARLQARMTTGTLIPLERHRLEMFYQDGPESFESAVRLRELLAMAQHQSDKPIRPSEVIQSLLAESPRPPGPA